MGMSPGAGGPLEGPGGAGAGIASPAAGGFTSCALPSGTFSLLVAMLLFSVQQFMLISLLFVKTKSWLVLLFLCWDIPLLIFMASTLSPRVILNSEVASVRCVVQWMSYILTLGTKMAVMAFCPVEAQPVPSGEWAWQVDLEPTDLKGYPIPSTVLEPSSHRGNSYESLAYVGVYLLPVIFVVFTARARAAMRPAQAQSVSIETALHADLALSLALDFLDVTIMFNENLEQDSVLRVTAPGSSARWLCFSTLVLCVVSTVTLGFAFPTQQSLEGASGQADIFLSAKFEFLVGLLLLDIPFLVLRVYGMFRTERIFWFFLKNVFTIFVRPLKLNQCRLAERERAKGTQKTFYETPNSQQQLQQQAAAAAASESKAPPQQNAAASAAAAVSRGVFGNIQKLRQRGSLQAQKQGGGDRGETTLVSPPVSKDYDNAYLPISSIGSGFPGSSLDSESDGEPAASQQDAVIAASQPKAKLTRAERQLLRDLRYSRRIPAPGVGLLQVVWRLLVLLFSCKGGCLCTVLDGHTYLSCRQQLRLAVGTMLLDLLHIALVLMGLSSFVVAKGSGDEFSELFPVTPWSSTARRDQCLVITWGISVFVCLCTSVFTVPLLDSLFCCCCFAVRQLSRCLLYRVLGFTYLRAGATAAAAAAAARLKQEIATDPAAAGESSTAAYSIQPHHVVALILTVAFISKPLASLARCAAAVPLSLCGKRYNTLHADKYVRDTASESFIRKAPGSPSPSFVSLSNMVVFSLCRQAAAPLAYHSLLPGPDTTKGFRVCDGLLDSMWGDLLLSMVLRVWGVSVHLSWFNFGAFCGHLLFGLLYLMLAQAVRIMTLRRYEIKLMLEDLVRNRTDDLRMFGDAESSDDEQHNQRLRKAQAAYSYITIADEAELYKRDGYISSPGLVFPRMV